MTLAALVLLAVWRRLAGRMEALERLRHLSAQVVGAVSLQRLAEVALAGLQPEVGATRAVLGAALAWCRCCRGAASSACSRCAGPSATRSTASRRPCSA
jgi:hypothetical protein